MGAGASIGDVKARLTLDTAAFDGPMKQSSATATASSRAIEQAAKRAAEAQAFAAKFAGDAISQQTLRILDARKMETAASADMRKAQALNRTGYLGEQEGANLAAAALQRLTAAKAATAAASVVANHATISQMQATSAAVRSLEGNPGIRATERFLTTIPGIGEALRVAFPLIGGIAFAAMVGDLIAKVVEFIKKLNEMPDAIRRGFESMHLATSQANDQLRLTNDELQNAINKLQGKEDNNLALELDEARIKADDLAKSLEEDVKKVKELLAANNISELGSLLGKASTSSVAGSVNSFQQKFSDIGYKRSEAVRSNDTDTVASLDHELAQVRQQALDWAADQLNVRNNKQSVSRLATAAPGGGIQYQGKTYQDFAGDQSGNTNILQGFRTTIQDSQDREQLKSENGSLVAVQKAAENKKRMAAEGLAAANKAAQERLRAMEDDLNSQKQQQGMSVKAEYDFWAARIAAFKVGSTEYTSLLKKTADLAEEGARKASETIRRFQQSHLKGEDSGDRGDEIVARYAQERQRDAVRALGDSSQDALDSNQLAIQQARNQAREQEAQVTDQAGRSITKYDAAIEQAQIHAKEFAAVMEGLQADLDIKQFQQSLAPTKEGAKGVAEAQAAIAVTISQRTIQTRSDDVAINGRDTSPLVGATDALRDFIEATRDSAAEMRNFIDKTLNSLNSELVRAISTRGSQRAGFADLGAGIARNVAGTALQKGEGSILGMFGLGTGKKPTGAKGDPLYVAFAGVASGGASAPASLGSDAIQAAMQGADGVKGSSAGMTVSSLAGMALKLLPMFANGTSMINANTMSIIGEKGPELFMPSTSGSIIPNSRLGNMGGGDTHSWTIDARGSSDPAAMEAAANRAIMAAAPHLVSASVSANRERQMRMAPSRRGS